jgi:copper chaperone CopZ
MSLLVLLLCLQPFDSRLPALAQGGDDAFTVTFAFEKMHCDECKAEVEAILKKKPGFKSLSFTETSAVAAFDEKAAVPAAGGFPKDLSLRAVRLSIRGTVSFAGDRATLVAKGSGAALALANASPQPDRLAELRKALGGKNRFRVTGLLAVGKGLLLEGFEAADWRE